MDGNYLTVFNKLKWFAKCLPFAWFLRLLGGRHIELRGAPYRLFALLGLLPSCLQKIKGLAKWPSYAWFSRLLGGHHVELLRAPYRLFTSFTGAIWRREGDSNPRYGFPYTRFPSVRLQPLGHLSICCSYYLSQ